MVWGRHPLIESHNRKPGGILTTLYWIKLENTLPKRWIKRNEENRSRKFKYETSRRFLTPNIPELNISGEYLKIH
jgi:hypothetical protein